MNEYRCGYLVVGAGASGCVVAARLSEDRNCKVILLEAGGGDRNPFLRLPGLGFAAGAIQTYNWNFATEPMPELNNRRMTLLQGKVMGGSSSINGMIYTRGHSTEYDRWRDMGCLGWGFDDIRHWFLKSEGNARGADDWHGVSGPMKLRQANPRLPICDAFLEAAAAAGLPVVDDLNANHREGFGWYDVTIDRGMRMSAARAFLAPVRSRKNLRIMPHTQVLRVIFSGRRATGVVALHRGRLITVLADREIIICGGAIKTPQLLMLSGIGPADELRELDIEVLVDAPELGKNLQNHPCYRPRFACSQPVTAVNHLSVPGVLRAGVSYAMSRSGPLAESFASAGGFFRSDPSLALADMQVVMLSALPPGGNRTVRSLFDLIPRQQGFGLTIYQGTPNSRGEIGLRSSDPVVAPRIRTGYFADPRDIEVLASGVQRMRDVMRRPEIARYIGSEIAPGDNIRSRAELIEEIRREAGTSYHQCGTCAMGAGERAVVDSRLRVRGVYGIRVADTSIIPRLPNAALYAPALMIGEKAAAMIAEDAQC